jgi:hypothetical protein
MLFSKQNTMYNLKDIMCDKDITPCCWLFKPKTPFEIETSYDDNDQDILFKNNNPNGNQVIPNECIYFWCSSYPLGNNCILVKKVNYYRKISIVLTFQDENEKRVLLAGFILVDGKKYDVTDFKTYEVLELEGNTYENMAICNYNI